MEGVELLLAANRNYMTGVALTLGSLLRHYTGTTPLFINILASDWSEGEFERLEHYLEGIEGGSRVYEIRRLKEECGAAAYSTSLSEGHFSVESNVRLFVCDLFPDVPFVYYLDSDLYVEWDFQHFLDVDIGDSAIAACQGLGGYRFKDWMRGNKAFELDEDFADKGYFNAGVMIFNLDRCRKEKLDKKLTETVKAFSHRYLFSDGDQFVMNYVFRDDWFPLPVEFNKRLFLCSGPHPMVDERTEGVYHFVGREKPWNYANPPRSVARRANLFLKRSRWYELAGIVPVRLSTDGLFSDINQGTIGRRLKQFLTKVVGRFEKLNIFN